MEHLKSVRITRICCAVIAGKDGYQADTLYHCCLVNNIEIQDEDKRIDLRAL